MRRAPSSHPTEASLVGSAPERAIPLLFERHGPQIYALGVRICGDPAEAQDLVQETFLAAFENWQRFEGRSTPATWLYTIAARACQRLKRPRAGEPSHLEPLEDLLPGHHEPLPDLEALGPHEQAEVRERTALVQAAISELPIDFRMPLVLKDVAELPLRDIASILDLPVATAKTRIHRARFKLRKVLLSSLPTREPSRASTEPRDRRVCLDLLWAKQRALDRGVAFDVPDVELCERCRAVFASLDLTRDACRAIGRGELPGPVRQAVLDSLPTGGT